MRSAGVFFLLATVYVTVFAEANGQKKGAMATKLLAAQERAGNIVNQMRWVRWCAALQFK
jgi:hypothetical protein